MKFSHAISKAILIATLSMASIAQAGLIQVSEVSASHTFGNYRANNLINESGLSGDLHDGGANSKWLSYRMNGFVLFDWVLFLTSHQATFGIMAVDAAEILVP